jgi:hypothetical protein
MLSSAVGVAGPASPALLTRTFTGPSAAFAYSSASSQEAGSETSSRTKIALSRSSLTSVPALLLDVSDDDVSALGDEAA